MKEAIRQRARELGFDDCRVTSAAAPDSALQFQQWLARKYHGEMGYMERNAGKRIEPQRVLAGAKSVITVAASYGEKSIQYSVFGVQSRQNAHAQHKTGIIARYARYADYHNVVGERLKQLSAFVDKLGGDGTFSLWYVDTGPVLERDL